MRSVLTIVVIFLGACQYIPVISSAEGGRPGRSQNNSYSEDLSSLRPTFEVEDQIIENGIPEIEIDESDSSAHYTPVNDTVNIALDSIASIRLSENKVTGYTIMVYSSRSREEARKALGRFRQHLPDATADLVYQQPYFRVKTGKFMHEIHAYGLLEEIKQEFNTAIIVPETYKIIEDDK